MNQTTLFKLGGITLAAWATLGSTNLDTKSFGIFAVLMLLVALLDAGNGMQQAVETHRPAGQEFTARLFSLSCAPLYLGLLALVFVTAPPSDADSKAATARSSSVSMCGAEGKCGTSGGCGSGGCGSSSGGACGCSSGKAKATKPQTAKASPRQLTTEELRQRTEEVQKRAMANGGSASGLPGLGVNPRPLPPGLVPKAGAVVPPGVVVPASPPIRTAPPASAPPAISTSGAAAVSAQVTPTVSADGRGPATTTAPAAESK